jgi:hypothetical protein
MRIAFAIFVAVLSAIESFFLASLFISLVIRPGGSGEFTGINQFAATLFAIFFLPPVSFVIVLLMVLQYHRPENHKAFRSFAWGLVAALAMVAIGLIFTESRGSGTPWYLILNAIVLTLWTTVTLWWQMHTHDRDGSF